MRNDGLDINPQLDLVFERNSKLSIDQMWKGWTDPETLKSWFCPRPWKVTEARVDLRAAGEFYTLMEGPQGEKMPNDGCYLEVVPKQKLIWTNMLMKGFRPAVVDTMGFPFVATILFSQTGSGTLYRAIVKHGSEDARKRHEQMGFQEGWGLAYKQLEDLMSK